MRATNGADICDPKVATHKYEMLRANALGSINRAAGFTLFLRNGMSAWLRGAGQDSAPAKDTSRKFVCFHRTGCGHASCGVSVHSDRCHPQRSEAGNTLEEATHEHTNAINHKVRTVICSGTRTCMCVNRACVKFWRTPRVSASRAEPAGR